MFAGRVSVFPYEKVPGYGSTDEFKRECANSKGERWDEGKYSTACHDSGGTTVGDENGKN